MNRKNEYLLIVDGSSLLATSYYASLPKPVRKEKDEEKKEKLYPVLLKRDSHGRYCNALDLFFHTLFTIMTFQHPSHLVICWDAGRNTFRKELWPAYKSNRQTTPAPLREQFETAYGLCDQLGICQVRDSRYEADDFAGSIACQMAAYLPVRIFTRDKDYFQLITDRIQIWYGMADLQKVKQWRKTHNMPPCLPSRVVLIDENVLKKEFGYSPASVPMIKSLFGDSSDNIPGVSGMGEQRSIQLAEHYHSVEDLYAPIEAARTRAQRKKLSRQWKSWGISVSPYTVLTRKGTPNRLDAREMADLCYTLGKIRTDLDLSDCFSDPFGPELFRIQIQPAQIIRILEPYNIHLKIGRGRGSEEWGELSGRKGRTRKKNTARATSGARRESGSASRPAKKNASRNPSSKNRSKVSQRFQSPGPLTSQSPAAPAVLRNPAEREPSFYESRPVEIAKAATPWQSARKASQYRQGAGRKPLPTGDEIDSLFEKQLQASLNSGQSSAMSIAAASLSQASQAASSHTARKEEGPKPQKGSKRSAKKKPVRKKEASPKQACLQKQSPNRTQSFAEDQLPFSSRTDGMKNAPNHLRQNRPDQQDSHPRSSKKQVAQPSGSLESTSSPSRRSQNRRRKTPKKVHPSKPALKPSVSA